MGYEEIHTHFDMHATIYPADTVHSSAIKFDICGLIVSLLELVALIEALNSDTAIEAGPFSC